MLFTDFPVESMPSDGHYYFNVLLINIRVRPDDWWELMGTKNSDVWYLEKLTEPRPTVHHFYQDEELNEKSVIAPQDIIPHTVIEVRDNGEVSWYRMINYATTDNWGFEEDPNDGFVPLQQ